MKLNNGHKVELTQNPSQQPQPLPDIRAVAAGGGGGSEIDPLGLGHSQDHNPKQGYPIKNINLFPRIPDRSRVPSV